MNFYGRAIIPMAWVLIFICMMADSAQTSAEHSIRSLWDTPFKFSNFQGEEFIGKIRILPSSGNTLPVGTQFVLMYNGEIELTVTSIHTLEGNVFIRNEDDARSFVRIMSSERIRQTYFREWVGWEVSSKYRVDELNISIREGDKWGKVDDIVVTKIDGGNAWWIHRTVLAPTTSIGVFRVIDLDEVVTNQGRYERVSETPKKLVNLDYLPMAVGF